MLEIIRWPPYRAARRALDANALHELEGELVAWTAGLGLADDRDEVVAYAGSVGRPGWIELGEFEVLAQLALDEAGDPSVLRLMQLRRTEH